jgi:hypothetical protein
VVHLLHFQLFLHQVAVVVVLMSMLVKQAVQVVVVVALVLLQAWLVVLEMQALTLRLKETQVEHLKMQAIIQQAAAAVQVL